LQADLVSNFTGILYEVKKEGFVGLSVRDTVLAPETL